jgi:uncharacterized protein YecE (DUF72 family)
MGTLYLGTQSWSHKDWVGVFYPEGTAPADTISEYARHFNTVEIDSTFYGIPRETTVMAWRERTPEGFVFAAKFPQVITHEKIRQPPTTLEACRSPYATQSRTRFRSSLCSTASALGGGRIFQEVAWIRSRTICLI